MKARKILVSAAIIVAALLCVILVQKPNAQTTTTLTTTILPLPLQSTNTYTAKFICGMQGDQGTGVLYDAQPGTYSTKINVHNNTGVPVNFRKKAIWLLKPNAAGQIAYGEQPTAPQAKKFDSLKEDEALEVVCRDIYTMIGASITPPAYAEGFVVFEVYYQPKSTPPPPDPLDVEGIYTYRGFQPPTTIQGPCCGVSINVVNYPAKNNPHILQ